MNLKEELMKLNNEDYQNRGGNAPRANVPTNVTVNEWPKGTVSVVALFKDTTEGNAKKWLDRYLNELNFEYNEVFARQDGDYKDDWVEASVSIEIPNNENNEEATKMENVKKSENLVEKNSKGKVSNKQMIPAIKDNIENEANLKALKTDYPDIFTSSLKYIGKRNSEKLTAMGL